MVIRHFRRHDEFFEELDSFPGSDAPSYFVDQMIVVLRAEPFELLVLGELVGEGDPSCSPSLFIADFPAGCFAQIGAR